MNSTNDTCPPTDEKWWVFISVSAVLYVGGLMFSIMLYLGKILFLWRQKRWGHEDCKVDQPPSSTTSLTTYLTEHTHKKRSFLRRVGVAMRHAGSGVTIPSKILILVTVVCNIIFMVLALYRSYQPVERCITVGQADITLELIISVELIVYFFIRFLAVENVVKFWINVYTVIDVFTLPHVFVAIALGRDWLGLKALRFIWLNQIRDIFRFIPFLKSQDIVDILSLLVRFASLWLTATGIVHLIESSGDPWSDDNAQSTSFLDFAYFIMVTMSTVGYGDLSPVTAFGKAFVTFFIIAGLAFFAAILPALADIVSAYYSRTQYAKFDTSRVPRHVIVCGYITATSVDDFLKDFLHPDRGDRLTHILLLHPERPNQELRTVIRSNYTRVQYIKGSVLNSKYLMRAKLTSRTATACFILADKHCKNPLEEDHANLLRLVSIKNTTTKIPVIIQVLLSSSKEHVENIPGWNRCDIVVSLNEMKLGLLGQSCLCPGLSTLIANLFYASDFPKIKAIPGQDEHEFWKKNYTEGASNEIYPASFSPSFNGKKFHKAAKVCYEKLSLVLLALEDTSGKIYINPSPLTNADLVIHSQNMQGYFIGPDLDAVCLVSKFCIDCHSNLSVVSRHTLSVNRCTCSSEKREESTWICVENANGIGDDSISLTQMPTYSYPEKSLDVLPAPRWRSTSLPTSPNKHRHISHLSHVEERDLSDSLQRRLKGFYISPPRSQDSCHLNPDTPLSGHIVLCLFAADNSPALGLHNFLSPLRSKNIPHAHLKPVVIISSKAYLEKEWPNICAFPDIHLVIGSPLEWKKLTEARVGTCQMCVILTALVSSSSHEQAIDDKEVVLCSLTIQKHFGYRVRIITDLIQESNVQFLDIEDEDEDDGRIYQSQPFACGEAFASSMFDSITTSAFHCPGTLYLVENLISAASTNGNSCQVVAIPLNSSVYSKYIDCPFNSLYTDLLDQHSVCLGINRLLDPESSKHYVITAPDSHMKLKVTDVAFVLIDCANLSLLNFC